MTEIAFIEGTFEDARIAVNNSSNIGTFELTELAEKAGLDPKTAHQLVATIQAATKKQLMKELRKQTENMLYWVERA